MNYHAWLEHFKEQLQGLTQAFEKSGSSLSLLGYALETQRLSREDYTQWATSFYNLPKLQSRFFTETPLSQEMFAKWATHYPWSTECLPVAEWDGSLIVACLQPPQDFPNNPTSILVIADFDDLKKTWAFFKPQKNNRTSANMLDVTEMPEGIDVTLATQTIPNQSHEMVTEDIALSSENTTDSLDGIFSQTPLVTLTPLQKEPSAKSSKVEVPLKINKAAVPEKTAVLVSTKSNHEPDLVLADELPAEQITPIVTSEVTVTSLQSQMPTPPTQELAPTTSHDDGVVAKPLSLSPRIGGGRKPSASPITSGQFALDKVKKQNSSLINENIQAIFHEMKAHFAKSIILTLDADETQFTAFAWDESFQGVKDTSVRFPLKTPSIFNIVASTQKPFHGYISLNEVNEKFFEDWNQGHIPDHVTIVPITIDEKLVGMLMGFGEKSAYNKNSLLLAERLSSELTKGLEAA